MAKHKIHKLIDKLLFGRAYPEIHLWLDQPVKIVGPRHRKYRHDAITVARILIKYRDVKPALAALMHILIDKLEE